MAKKAFPARNDVKKNSYAVGHSLVGMRACAARAGKHFAWRVGPDCFPALAVVSCMQMC